MDLDVGIVAFAAVMCQGVFASVFWLISFRLLAISAPLLVSLLIFLGGLSSLSIRPSMCKLARVLLHHCSVIPTCLAISLFWSWLYSKRVSRIFCLTVRNILTYGRIGLFENDKSFCPYYLT